MEDINNKRIFLIQLLADTPILGNFLNIHFLNVTFARTDPLHEQAFFPALWAHHVMCHVPTFLDS